MSRTAAPSPSDWFQGNVPLRRLIDSYPFTVQGKCKWSRMAGPIRSIRVFWMPYNAVSKSHLLGIQSAWSQINEWHTDMRPFTTATCCVINWCRVIRLCGEDRGWFAKRQTGNMWNSSWMGSRRPQWILPLPDFNNSRAVAILVSWHTSIQCSEPMSKSSAIGEFERPQRCLTNHAPTQCRNRRRQ